jgi:hypothetical protein
MKYLEKVREIEKHFKGYSVQHIPRDDNNEADKLAKAAARNQELPPDVFFEIIREPSIKESRPKIVNVVHTPDFFERKPWGNTPGNRRNILKEETKLQGGGTYVQPNQWLGNERE